jgi:hypothetical protein
VDVWDDPEDSGSLIYEDGYGQTYQSWEVSQEFANSNVNEGPQEFAELDNLLGPTNDINRLTPDVTPNGSMYPDEGAYEEPNQGPNYSPEYWHADYEEEWTPPENQVAPESNTQFHGHAGDGAEDVPAQTHQVLEAEVEDDAYQDDVEEPNRLDPPPDLVSDSSDGESDTHLELKSWSASAPSHRLKSSSSSSWMRMWFTLFWPYLSR